MRKMIFLAALSLLFSGSCTSMSEPDSMVLQELEIDNPNYISVEEAMHNAEKHFTEVFGPQTRADRKVKDVEVFRSPNATRSEDGDEMFGFYIVNYENDGGFAMLSADRRREEVYAISDEGSLHLADTLDNKGLSWYINQYTNELTKLDGSITKPTLPIDTLTPNPGSITTTIGFITMPLIKDFMAKFHQESPYNKYCFTKSGSQAVVGCVPLAVGTVMGYYEWPKIALGYKFNWNEMKENSSHDGWSRLFEVLGRPTFLNVNYGIYESGSTADERITFKKLGYETPQSNLFDPDIVNKELSEHNIIICTGITLETPRPAGHDWVIDGGYFVKESYPGIFEENILSLRHYYNCVWGWGGSGNGFFYYNNGKIGGAPGLVLNPHDVYNFSHLTIIYGFVANK